MFKTVFLLLILFACGYAQTVTITIANQNIPDDEIVPVVEGNTITLRCTTTDTDALIVLSVEPVGSVNFVENAGGTTIDKEYTVNNIERDDNGVRLQCSDGSVNSAFIIDVQFPPNISNIVDGAGPEGGSANVTFTIDANPAVVESGIRVTPMMPDDIVIINGSTVTLTYDDLERSDNRSYYLFVNNSVDTRTFHFDLTVYFGPDFTNNGGSIEVTVNQSLSIDCSVSDSNPTVLSVNISGYDITGMMNVPDNGGSRVFTVTNAVTTDFNNRMYTCSASNGETMTSITYTVTVVQPTSSSRSISLMPSSSSSMSTSISLSYSASPTGGPDPDTGGLSDGTIAGITVAAIGGGLILIGIGVLLLVCGIMKMRGSAKA